MCIKTTSGIQNLFSLAARDRCITNLKKFNVQKHRSTKTPTAAAAVLVPLCRINGAASLLYTVRSLNLRTNSGQISFPGGMTDKNETAIETALRETEEEIGLSASKIDIWGQGPTIPGRDNKILITPVVGSILELKQDDLSLNTNEVSEVFAVPIEVLCDPNNQFYTQFKNGFILPVFVAEGHKIWGVTAYITHVFLNSLLSRDIYRNEWMKKRIVVKDEVAELL